MHRTLFTPWGFTSVFKGGPFNQLVARVIDPVVATIALESFDHSTGELIITTDTPNQGSYLWGRFPAGTSGVIPDGLGGFSSAPLESGSESVGPVNTGSIFDETGTTGMDYEMFVYQRIGAVDSNVIGLSYTADNTAPTILSAATNVDGNETVVTFDEDVAGVTALADWTLNADGEGVTISAISVVGVAVTLTHVAVIGGASLTLDYSGALTDLRGNVLASVAGQAVTNNAAFAAGNLISNSADFTAASWVIDDTGKMTITADQDGVSDLVVSTADGHNGVSQSLTGIVDGPHNLSIEVKKPDVAGADWLFLQVQGGSSFRVRFDVATGTIGGDQNLDPEDITITDIGDGYYRCSFEVANLAGPTGFVRVNVLAGNNTTEADNLGLLVRNIQLTEGLNLKPYSGG